MSGEALADREGMWAMNLNPADLEILEELLKTEIAAADCFGHALEALDTEDFRSEVAPMSAHHEEWVERLQALLQATGRPAQERPGPLGTIVIALERVVSTMGERACLMFLEEQEHRHVARFQELALNAEHPQLTAVIDSELLPAAKAHRGSLDKMVWSLRHGADPRRK